MKSEKLPETIDRSGHFGKSSEDESTPIQEGKSKGDLLEHLV